MSKPYIHSLSSAKKYGGKPEDYIEIHSLLDSSKGAVPSNLHRALCHNSWFLSVILERIKFKNSYESSHGFFPTIINSDGKHVSVRDVGEQHILEDFRGKFIPTAQDYLGEMEFKPWMQNGGGSGDYPPSYKKISESKKDYRKILFPDSKDIVYDGSNLNQPLPEEDNTNKLID